MVVKAPECGRWVLWRTGSSRPLDIDPQMWQVLSDIRKAAEITRWEHKQAELRDRAAANLRIQSLDSSSSTSKDVIVAAAAVLEKHGGRSPIDLLA